MRRSWCLSAVAFLSVILCAAAWAAPPVTYARLSLGQGEKATVYLSFENARLRLATSPAGLDKATAVQAKEREIGGEEGSRSQRYTFPETDLPAAPAGFARASGTFTYMRSSSSTRGVVKPREMTYFYGDVTLTREASGTTWGYVCSVSGDAGRTQVGADKQHPIAVSVPKPDPAALTFDIVTKVEGRKVRIGMQPKAGQTDINNVLKNGKPAPATLEVTDKDGKVIVSEKGDPQKFGFT